MGNASTLLSLVGTLSDIFGHDCSWLIREKLSTNILKLILQ